MGPAAVRGGGSPPHATPPCANAFRRTLWERGRCSSPTSATDLRHAYLDGPFDSRGGPPACAEWPRSLESEPQRTTRVTTCLTTRPELQPARLTPRRLWRRRASPDPDGLSIESSPQVTPPCRGVVFRGKGRTRQPLTPRSPCTCAVARMHRQERLPHRPVKAWWFRRSRAPSVDECPLDLPACARRPRTRTRHRSRGFATPTRLPTLFRPALPREAGLDKAASERSSRSGAPCHAPLVDFCNRNDPQARPTGLRDPAPRSGRSTCVELPIPGRVPRADAMAVFDDHASGAREPRLHGSGADCIERTARAVAAPASLAAIARGESFTPTRSALGHLLSRFRRQCGWSRRTERWMRQRAIDSRPNPLARARAHPRAFARGR